ncbi:MAG TPA: ABC transporter substrate-binding protein [Aestuariivirga sp.]|nr:ABC transporter substrate-binding protein [Aestuariivirga sp.]
MQTQLITSHRIKRKFSRREFIQYSLATGMTLAAAEGLWVKSARAEQIKGGHMGLALAGGSTTDTLEPTTYSDTVMLMLGFSVRGNLAEVMPDGSVKPELAESFEPSEKGTKWQVKLRKGVQFSNGKSLTVDDVIKSLNLHRGEASKSAVKAMVEAISDVKADGPDSLLFTLREGNADFPYILADYHLNIMPFEGDQYDPKIGCGPFLLKSFEPGVRVILERNPNSYKSAFIDSAELVVVTDPTARQSALQGGSADIINRPDFATAQMLSETAGIKVVDVNGRMHYTMPGDARISPYNNTDFCTAMKFAINREEILEKVLFGHGTIGNDSPITPSYKYFAEDLKPRPYDLDKARFHLKKSGLEGAQVNLSASDTAFGGADNAALLFAESAAKAGLKVNVIREPADGYWDNVWLKKEFCMAYWGGRPTEDIQLTSAYHSQAAWNETHWNNKQFDDLLAAARSETDDAKRRTMYHDLQHLIANEGSTIIPIFANHVHASTDKVVTPEKMSGAWELDGGRCLERWSLAS